MPLRTAVGTCRVHVATRTFIGPRRHLRRPGSATGPSRDAVKRRPTADGDAEDVRGSRTAEDAWRARNRRFELLSEISARLLRAENPQAVVEDLCRALMAHLGCDCFFNYLVDPAASRLHLNACSGIPESAARQIEWLDYGIAVCGCVARSGQRICAEDIQHSDDRRTELVRSFGMQAYVCHPLIAEGRVIGTLSFGTRTRPAFAPDEIELMKTVADQVAVAMQRILANAALAASEARFRQLADAMPQLVWTADPDGKVDYYNGRHQEFSGLAQTASGAYDWVPVLHPDDQAATVAAWQRAVATGSIYQIEHRGRRADGTFRWYLSRGIPVRDAAGRIVKWFGTATDVHELRIAQEELAAAKVTAERARAVAEEASRAKDHFLAVLSHELRTPLTPVLASAAALERDPRLPSVLREDVEMIRRNAELEARLIDDLLDLTRIARGKVRLHRRAVDLGTILERTVEVCRPDLVVRRLSFSQSTSGQPHVVNADSARLQQVFWNLLKNATKFTPPGGLVEMRRWTEGDRVIVEVRDTGVGIAPEALGRIFHAFEQAERATARQFGGLGLGLAISKALVELHGGTVSATSAGPGCGATFTVSLPLAARAGKGEQRPEPQHRVDDARGRGGLRILLVEDHADTARILSRVLQAAQHRVCVAGNVALALEEAARGTFDLLVSDLGLPDGSGMDLLRELRARGAALPAIALTGYGQEEDVQRTRAAGFAAHLTKPIDLDELERAIARACGAPGA